MRLSRWLRHVFFGIGGVCLVGCGKPSIPAVDAVNMSAFRTWRSSASDRYSVATWREFDDATLEIRNAATGSPAMSVASIDEAVCSKINGRTVAEVIRIGSEMKLARLRTTRSELKRMLDANALMSPMGSDPDIELAVETKVRDQQDRLRALDAEIRQTRTRVTELGGNVAPISGADSDLMPAVLPRELALEKIRSVLETRRKRALPKQVPPIQIDRDGTNMPDPAKATVAKLREEVRPGSVVVGVRLYGHWWAVSVPITSIQFSPAVTGNLTESDRAEISRCWENWQIEQWAREHIRPPKDWSPVELVDRDQSVLAPK